MTSDRFMIVLGRIDVNKKPFRLIEIPDFLKCDPVGLNCFKQIEWPPFTRFDHLCGALAARIDPVQRSERLRAGVHLNWDHGIMVQSQFSEVQEELRSDKRKVTSDDDGPFTIRRRKGSMKTPECSPLRINI